MVVLFIKKEEKMEERMIVVQFSFSNRQVVPDEFLPQRQEETAEEAAVRFRRSNGEKTLESLSDHVYLHDLHSQMNLANYFLVDAFYQKKFDSLTQNRKIWVVRFVFVREDYLRGGKKESPEKIINALNALRELCETSMWRVSVYENPYFEKGEKADGKTLSINMVGRKPIFDKNGAVCKEWPRDNFGNRVGDCTKAIEPREMVVIGDQISIVDFDRG